MKQSPPPSPDDDMALALTALAWILSDAPRAERFLALTGLTPDGLRGALTNRATQAAILSFLTAHENDLVSCAAAIDSDPAALAAAAARLES
jgi:Protein of unknown function (DUF3572)